MVLRRFLRGCGLVALSALAFTLPGCATYSLVSIQVTPTTQYFTLTPGLTVQYTAIGTFDQGTHPKITRDITSQVTWKSNSTGMITINSAGLATTTGKEYGSAIITAEMNGFTGLIVAPVNANVCGPGQSVVNGGCSSSSN